MGLFARDPSRPSPAWSPIMSANRRPPGPSSPSGGLRSRTRPLLKTVSSSSALFLFLPFYWTWKRPPRLFRSSWVSLPWSSGAIFFFVTASCPTIGRASKPGAMATVIYGTLASLVGGYLVFRKKVLGMGTMEWILSDRILHPLRRSQPCNEGNLRKELLDRFVLQKGDNREASKRPGGSHSGLSGYQLIALSPMTHHP